VLGATSIARADSSTVLLFPFENQSNDRTLDWIGEGISELINQRLQHESGVYITSREERIAVYEDMQRRFGVEPKYARRMIPLRLGLEMEQAALRFWRQIAEEY